MIALVLALVPFVTAPEPPKELKGVRTIVTLGDSITQGGGNPGGSVERGPRSNGIFADKGGLDRRILRTIPPL